MKENNRFIKRLNEIIISKYFSLIISLIGLSVSTGLFADKYLGFFGFIVIVIFLLFFILVTGLLSRKSKIGYCTLRAFHKWKMEDTEGYIGGGQEHKELRLIRPLKSICEPINAFEKLTAVIGQEVVLYNEIMDKGQKIAIINLDAEYPKNYSLSYTMITERRIPKNKDGKYIEIPIPHPTKVASAEIQLPPNNNAQELNPSLYQRKSTILERIPVNEKNILGLYRDILSVHPDPWIISWDNDDPEDNSTYIIRWDWNTQKQEY